MRTNFKHLFNYNAPQFPSFRIGAIFCICWLPLNILNALRDTSTLTDSMSEEVFCGVYAVCHVLGMSSACANPVIYGFLNENFSKEFRCGRKLDNSSYKDNILFVLCNS